MSGAEFLAGLLDAVRTGKKPDTDSFQDCLIRSGLALVDEYVQADTALTNELDRLLAAFRNRKDPWVKSMGILEHTAAASVLNTIRIQREKHREQRKKELVGGSV